MVAEENKALLIKTDNTYKWIKVPTDHDLQTKMIQDAIRSPIGDYDIFERVQFFQFTMSMWVNEFGTNPAFGCKINPIASVMNRDTIYGDVLLTCETDDGYICGLNKISLEFANAITKSIDSMVPDYLLEEILVKCKLFKCYPFG